MKKLVSLFLVLFLSVSTVCANQIDRALTKSKINKNAVSICIKDAKSGKILYEHNSRKPMMPASTLKAVTYITALNELGKDYEFTTSLYKTVNNELIFKLGADPFLTNENLNDFMQLARDKAIYEPKAIKFDDSILDRTEWGEGWQWDDDLNPLMPKFSAYNLDENMLIISVDSVREGAPAELRLREFYPLTLMNMVVASQNTDIKVSRNNSISPDIIKLEGTVDGHAEIKIPVNFPRRYFIMRLSDAIRSKKILYYGNFVSAVLPDNNVYLVGKVANPIDKATPEVMQKSNNMIAETVFKLAGGHFAKGTGTIDNAREMFLKHCSDMKVNTEDIKIADGSGVSKNNLVTADFMTNFLIAQSNEDENYRNIFAKPGEGTLKKRMLYMGDKLQAKSGTLSQVSALTGFITTLSGKTYVFDIMINDARSTDADKKMLEEYILRAVYGNY